MQNTVIDTYTRLFPHCSKSSRPYLECTLGPTITKEPVLAQEFSQVNLMISNWQELIPKSRSWKQSSLILPILVHRLRMVAQPARGVYQRRSAGAVLRRHIYRALEPTTESGGECRNCPREGADLGVNENSLA